MILITIDTLRADHLSAYGYQRPTSPHLDAFIARGTAVRWAFSTASSTAPSHASIMVGSYPSFNTVGRLNGLFELEDSATTLAELCAERGLQTAAIISNPVLRSELGLDQGFKSYDDDLESRELNRDLTEQTAPRALDKALAKLDEFRDAPFFLWLHFQDPHGPYTPPPEFVEAVRGVTADSSAVLPVGDNDSGHRAIPTYQVLGDERRIDEYVARYDGEIAYLDSHLKVLFERLEALGLLDRTLVAITSDHGEALGEDGFYFAHGHSVGADLVRVPLAFVGPGVLSGGVLAGPISNLDIFATVLDFLSIEVPAATQSASLWPLLTGDASQEAPRPAFTEGPQQVGIASGDVYLRRARAGEAQQVVRLGSTAATPADEVAATLRAFTSRADSSLAAIHDDRTKTAVSPEQLKHLRALGYVN